MDSQLQIIISLLSAIACFVFALSIAVITMFVVYFKDSFRFKKHSEVDQ